MGKLGTMDVASWFAVSLSHRFRTALFLVFVVLQCFKLEFCKIVSVAESQGAIGTGLYSCKIFLSVCFVFVLLRLQF